MFAQIIKIYELCTTEVTFYTIKFDEKPISEYTDFNRRLSTDPNNDEELDILQSAIDEVGERGALRRYFNRDENDAFALPPTSEEFFIESQEGDYGIRLYCVVLNKRIVFLLNGDRKKTQKATDPKSNVSRYFYMANSLHQELMKDKIAGIIKWNEEGKFDYDNDYTIDVKG